MDFSTKKDTEQAFINRLGFNMPKATDIVKRENYATEEAYIDAVIEYRKKQSDPAYREIYRTVSRELTEAEEKEIRQKQREQHNNIIATVTLTQEELTGIDAEATRYAKADLTAGKIAGSEYADRILYHVERLKTEKKESKANAIQLNNLFRGEST